MNIRDNRTRDRLTSSIHICLFLTTERLLSTGRCQVTVTKYRVTSLNVHWQCRAVTAEGSLDQPSYVITGDDLKR